MRKLDARQVAREKNAFRYSSALERGDFSTVEVVLQEAERDPLLAQMLAEINMVYENELIRLSPPSTGLNHSNNHHREDLLMTTITLPAPQRSVQRWLPYTLAAACLSVLFIAALLMLPYPSGGNWLAALQGRASETPTVLPTIVPTSTPLPMAGVNSNGTPLSPTVIPPAGDFTPTLVPLILGPRPTVVPPEATPVRDFTFEIMKAQAFKTQGQYAEAATVYETILSLEPQYDTVLYLYGLVLLELDRANDALNVAQQLIAIHAADVRAYRLQTLANLTLGYPATALASANKGYAINPADADILAAMSQSYVALQQFDEALKFAEMALQADSTSANAYQAYGWALAALGRRDEAIPAFEQAIQYDVDHLSRYTDLALQYKATNRMDDAIKTIEQFLVREPDNTKAMVELCKTYTQSGNNDAAETYCNNAIKLDPTDAEAYQVLGGVHFRQRNYAQAIEDFEQCTALGSEAIECQYQKGLAYYYIGGSANCEAAWNALNTAAGYNPDQAVFEIINTGLKLITENCPRYNDAVIAINPPATVADAVISAGSTFTPTPIPAVIVEATATPVPMAGTVQQAIEATATPFPLAGVVVPTVVPPAPVVSSGAACEAQDAVIRSPANHTVVAAQFEVTGMAGGENFASYRLELIGLATGGNYVELLTSSEPVNSEGLLGTLDLGKFPPNNYGLRLTVFDTQNQVRGACLINFKLARSTDVATEAQAANGLPPATSSAMPAGFVSAESATLREEPSANANAITTLKRNTAVGVYQSSPDGLWLQVVLGDQTQGWLLTSEVVGVAPTDFKPQIMCSGMTGDHPTQLFSRPNLTGNAVAIGSIEPHMNVMVLDVENQTRNAAAWYYVQLLSNPGLLGWISGEAFAALSYCSQDMLVPTLLPSTGSTISTVLPPTLMPNIGNCEVVNTSQDSVPVYSGPSSDATEAVQINNLPPNTTASALYSQTGSDGQQWYLVLALMDGGKQISGWVSGGSIQTLANCPPVTP